MEAVRRLRLAKGWTQPQLAFYADLAPSVISLIETGKRDPNATTLRKLADALDVRIPDLFEESDLGKAQPPLPLSREEDLRGSEYLREWRRFVDKLVKLLEADPPQTSRELSTLFAALRAVIETGVFELGRESDPAKRRELHQLTDGFRRLERIAGTLERREKAQERRPHLRLLQGKQSA